MGGLNLLPAWELIRAVAVGLSGPLRSRAISSTPGSNIPPHGYVPLRQQGILGVVNLHLPDGSILSGLDLATSLHLHPIQDQSSFHGSQPSGTGAPIAYFNHSRAGPQASTDRQEDPNNTHTHSVTRLLAGNSGSLAHHTSIHGQFSD